MNKTMQDLTSHGKEFGPLPESNGKPLRLRSRGWLDLIQILEGHSGFRKEKRLQGKRKMWGDQVGGRSVVQREGERGSDGLEKRSGRRTWHSLLG